MHRHKTVGLYFQGIKSVVGQWGSLILILVLFSSGFNVQAQNSSNKGKDFWLGFMNHRNGTSAGMFLYITSDSTTSGTVSIPGQGWSKTFNVTANQMTLVQIPTSTAYVSCSDCIEDKGIHVTADDPIVIYSHIYHQYCSDATLVLPTQTTGKEYYVMSYEQLQSGGRSQFMIVANKDDTKVRITPTKVVQSNSGDKAADKSYEITLDKGEVYQGRAKSSGKLEDLTGTHIEVIDTGATANCRTVAVFSGSSDTYILCSSPSWGVTSRDNLYQQMYPTRSLGTRFVTIPFKGRTMDHLRIMATEDNTNYVIQHETGLPSTGTLDAGEFYDLREVSSTKYINASKPITVAQYQVSRRCGGDGDPSMTILNPIEQTLKNITVYSSEYEDIEDHYINVIIPNSGVSSFRIDGKTATFKQVPKYKSYSYARIDVSKGNHQMKSDVGFLAIAYGFANYESYGYSAGANVKDLTAKIELTNSASIDETENFICLGDSARFEGEAEYTVSKWVWDFGDGTTDTTQKVSHQYKDTGTYLVKLYTYKTNFDGCSTYDSTDLEVRVNGRSDVKFGSSLKCEKGTVNFTDSSEAPPGGSILVRYWIFHDNSKVYSSNSSKYYDTAGTYDVSLVVKSTAQCEDTLTKTITINPLPEPSFEMKNSCSADTNEFVNNTTIKSGGIDQIKWYFGDGDSSSAIDGKHFYQDSGTYIVQLYVTSDSGCIGMTEDTLIKYENFDVDFSYQDTCAGLDVELVSTSTTEGLPLKDYLWKLPGGVEFKDSTKLSYNFGGVGTYTVWLLASLDTLCRDSVSHDIVVDPNITAGFSSNSSCLGDTIQFISNSAVTGGTVGQLIWDLDDGFTGSTDTVNQKYTTKGSKTVQLIAITDQGCSDTSTQTITLLEPKINKLDFFRFCQNEDGTIKADLSLDGDTVDTWDWFIEGVTSTVDTVLFNSSTIGRYEVTLDIVTKNNCALSAFDSINVYTTPVADFSVSEVCIGEDLMPVDLSTVANGESIASHLWYLNGTLASSDQAPSIPTLTAGTNSLRLVVNTANTCDDVITKDVEVNVLPIPDFTYMDTCFGQNTSFSSTSTITTGSIMNTDWEYNDGVTTSGNTVTRFFPGPGEYSMMVKLTSDKGCTDSLLKVFQIAPKPVADVVADASSGCQPFGISFTNNSSVSAGSIISTNWDFGDGNIVNGVNPGYVYANPGSYTVQVWVETDAGCKDTVTVSPNVDVLPRPTAAFSYTPLEPSLVHSEVTFANTSSADATGFEWEISDGASYNVANPVHKFDNPGDFTTMLVAIAANGCRDTSIQTITVKLDFFLFAPSAFSPNGDLVNDKFGISGMIPEVEGYSMSIFNTWGERIYFSDDPVAKWDGTYKGGDVQTGTYAYMVRYRNIETNRWETISGVVHVIR